MPVEPTETESISGVFVWFKERTTPVRNEVVLTRGLPLATTATAGEFLASSWLRAGDSCSDAVLLTATSEDVVANFGNEIISGCLDEIEINDAAQRMIVAVAAQAHLFDLNKECIDSKTLKRGVDGLISRSTAFLISA